VTDGHLPDEALARLVRAEAGKIAALLTRRIGDFDIAEEAVQDAIVAALRTWRRDGVPANPGGWLALAARRRAIDRLRRRTRGETLVRMLADEPSAGEPDDRLAMLFACCHPALAPETRLALTLRAVLGLTTGQIARAFLVPEATLAQRVVRGKRKIVSAGISLTVPDGADMPSRLDDVLTVTYLAYNAGYLAAHASPAAELAEDAVWLADLICAQLPREPEALGLLALLLLLQSRAGTRLDAEGALVPLNEQDRSSWDGAMIARAQRILARAAAHHRPGRYQLQAALAACHADAPSARATDWLQILTLYDLLLRYDGSPIVRLNRAVALAEVEGPELALHEVEALALELDGYYLLHATRGELLSRLDRVNEAHDANLRAYELATHESETLLLERRLGSRGGRR